MLYILSLHIKILLDKNGFNCLKTNTQNENHCCYSTHYFTIRKYSLREWYDLFKVIQLIHDRIRAQLSRLQIRAVKSDPSSLVTICKDVWSVWVSGMIFFFFFDYLMHLVWEENKLPPEVIRKAKISLNNS